MKISKGRVAIIISVVLVGVSVIAFLGSKTSKDVAVAHAEDSVNIVEQLEESIDQAIEKDSMLGFSSNPYDYIENNNYYNSLIESGVTILPSLESALINETENGKAGLVQYILAVAIEEISQVEVHRISQINTRDVIYKTDYKSWGTSEQFLDQWIQAKEFTPVVVDEILKSTESSDAKIDELKKFGVLAIPEIIEYTSPASAEVRNASSSGNVTSAKTAELMVPELKKYVATFNLDKEQIKLLYSIVEE